MFRTVQSNLSVSICAIAYLYLCKYLWAHWQSESARDQVVRNAETRRVKAMIDTKRHL
jgi:hypothetical protein